jgi:hypothetical protein
MKQEQQQCSTGNGRVACSSYCSTDIPEKISQGLRMPQYTSLAAHELSKAYICLLLLLLLLHNAAAFCT